MTVALPPVSTPSQTAKRSTDEQSEVGPTDVTVFAYILTGLSAIGGFLFGYDTGVVSGAMLLVGKEFQLSTLWHEIIVSGTIAAAWVFSLVGGYIADSWGRKKTVLAASTVFLIGSVVMGAALNKETLLAGRIIVGVGVGIASMSVPVYIAESSHVNIRGKMVTVYNLGITMGQFFAGIVCGAFSMVDEGWRYMLGLAAIPAALQLLGLLFMPESPRYLVARGRIADAEEVLTRLRGKRISTSQEVESVRKSIAAEPTNPSVKATLVKILKTNYTRRALLLGCSLLAIQQLSGINTVMYYSASIIQMAGVGDYSLAIWISAGVAGMNFVCTFIGVFLVDKFGRRPLVLISLAGVITSLVLLGLGFLLMDLNSPEVTSTGDGVCGALVTCSQCIGNSACGFCFRPGYMTCLPISSPGPCESSFNSTLLPADEQTFTWALNWCPSDYSWIMITALCLYLLFFSPGMGPMPWTINSEIHPLWARSVSTSIATSFCWLFNLVISLTFLSLTEALTTYGAFFLYAGIAVLGFCLLWVTLPETKGRSLEDMITVFGGSVTDDTCSEYDRRGSKPYNAGDSGDVITTLSANLDHAARLPSSHLENEKIPSSIYQESCRL